MKFEIHLPEMLLSKEGIIKEVEIIEGTISHSMNCPVFWFDGEGHRVALIFEDENEIDELIDSLKYFKENKQI